MTIAIDARFIYTSTGRYVERLIRYLAPIDSGNDYVVLLRREDYDRWQPPASNFRKVLADYAPYTFGEQFGLARLLYRLHPDLVHFTMPQQPIFYFGRRITTIHDLTLIDYINKRPERLLKNLYKYHLKPVIFKFVMRWVVRSSDHVITPTEFIRRQLIDRYHVDPRSVTATLEATDELTAAPKPYPSLKGKDFLLYVGNAYPYKNVAFLIEAFARISQAHPNLRLVLAGKTDFFYEELAAMVVSHVMERIIFTGFVPDDQLAWLYRHAKLYVFPSLSEGFSLSGLEAMMQGLPVLSSNATCLPEVYGDAAAYFDPRDSDDLVAQINRLLEDEAARQALIDAGKRRVKDFSWARMAEQTLELYRHTKH